MRGKRPPRVSTADASSSRPLRGLRFAQSLSTARVVASKARSPGTVSASPSKRATIVRKLWNFVEHDENVDYGNSGGRTFSALRDASPLLLQQIQKVLRQALCDQGTDSATAAVLQSGLSSIKAARKARSPCPSMRKAAKKLQWEDACERWTCDVCTFVNVGNGATCEICCAPGPHCLLDVTCESCGATSIEIAATCALGEHFHCIDCIRSHVLERIECGECHEATCMTRGCDQEMAIDAVQSSLHDGEMEKYLRECLMSFAKSEESRVFECPGKGCACIMSLMPDSDPGECKEAGEALAHYEKYRIRCRDCSTVFCAACRSVPYHEGFTCRGWEEHVSARKCRFCGSADVCVEGEARHSVCSSKECRHRASFCCAKVLPCGHACCGISNDAGAECEEQKDDLDSDDSDASWLDYPHECEEKQKEARRGKTVADGIRRAWLGFRKGMRGRRKLKLPRRAAADIKDPLPAHVLEKSALRILNKMNARHRPRWLDGSWPCPPCMHPDCARPSAPCEQDYCGICWVEDLASAPVIKLRCGHVFHYECVRRKIINRWSTPHISFGFLECSVCREDISHPSLKDLLAPIHKIQQVVLAGALRLLLQNRMLRDESVVTRGVSPRYYKRPDLYAASEFLFYECHKCGKPYYGGRRNCGEAVEGDPDPKELVCLDCSGLAKNACVKRGHRDYVVWKCRFCCSIATWYCWGSTHFCEKCHAKCWSLKKLLDSGEVGKFSKVNKQPRCKGCEGKRGVGTCASECALGVNHPPQGVEFAIGCGICDAEKMRSLMERQGGRGRTAAEEKQ